MVDIMNKPSSTRERKLCHHGLVLVVERDSSGAGGVKAYVAKECCVIFGLQRPNNTAR
jgi:hypothetical protein